MATTTIEGTYENGVVQLSRKPEGIDHARVMVTFLQDERAQDSGDAEAARLRKSLIERLKRGVDFGGEPLPRREELYADRLRQW